MKNIGSAQATLLALALVASPAALGNTVAIAPSKATAATAPSKASPAEEARRLESARGALATALPTPAEPALDQAKARQLSTRPRLQAARAAQPPVVDGRLDDALWRDTPASDKFTQKFPHGGQSPAEPTELRIAYDDDAVYVAISCRQQQARIRDRLTRRDRTVEADWVSVAIDTLGDGKTAFDFSVNAAGVLGDAIRFNDTEVSSDWDDNWDARTAITAQGWSAELRIPLRILRFAALPVQTWGLQVRRYVSERQETSEWAYIPRSSGSEVSQYGRLEELRDLTPGSTLELSPFALGRYRRRDAQLDQRASGTDWALSAGLDLKWHPAQNLTIDAAINPDFAQVEADQVILNLTNFETNLPEKRRFFLEGIDTFSTPYYQLLYTRRIGRAPAPPALLEGEQLVDRPEPARIYGATKITGQLGDVWQFGALSAVTGRREVEAELIDGTRQTRTVDPLSVFNVLRVKRAFGGNGHLGLMGTSVARLERAERYPLVTDPQDPAAPHLLCPGGAPASAQGRCASNAHVAGFDWRWRSPSGDYSTTGQVVGSLLQGGPARLQPDGTAIQSGDLGAGVYAALNKEGGDHWLWKLNYLGSSRRFEINDLGYDERANRMGGGASLAYRTLSPWARTLETTSQLGTRFMNNLSGLRLERAYFIDTSARFANFWTLWTGLHYFDDYFDDREMGDGAALQRAARVGHELNLSSDPRARVVGRLFTLAQVFPGGVNTFAEATLGFNTLPQLDLELVPQASYTKGEPRFIDRGPDGQYLFGRLKANSVGAVARVTYTFMPRLSLQSYAQVFLARRQYSDLSSYAPRPGVPTPVIHLAQLDRAGSPLAGNPDRQIGALDLNVVLRWEFAPGSLFYLVYTRSQFPQVMLQPGDRARLDLGALRSGPAADVLMLKLSYWSS